MQRLKALFPNVRIRRNIEDADEVIIDAQSLSCPVCFSIFAETPLVLHCGHSFCQPCFRRLSHMEPVCPYCRTEFDPHTRYPKNFVLEKVLEAIYTNDKEDDPNRGKRNDNAFRIKFAMMEKELDEARKEVRASKLTLQEKDQTIFSFQILLAFTGVSFVALLLRCLSQ